VTGLLILIPVALVLGGVGLAAFLWALRAGQFEDLDGAAERILYDDETPSGKVRVRGTPDERRDPKGAQLTSTTLR
jgi:cbb3-type cytochrome oxidase maturation protein